MSDASRRTQPSAGPVYSEYSGERSRHLLRANAALDDESGWLAHLNRYVALFDLEPLDLASGDAPRFLRLRARTPRVVEQGPLVTILMPAFNAAETLEFAVRSALNQTWQPIELILIDDASTDATPDIARRLANSDDRIRVFHAPVNVGPYVCKNLVMNQTRGEFITGLDADEWAHPERIEHQMEFMLARPRIYASHDMMLRVRMDGRIAQFGQKDPATDDKILQIAYAGCFFERSFLVEQLGAYDCVRFGADAELIARARRLLGERFVANRRLGILSLDTSGSISRHPIFGISRKTGLSPTRLQYRDAYRAWHENLIPGDPDAARLPFPHEPRLFPAPEAMRVPLSDVMEARRTI